MAPTHRMRVTVAVLGDLGRSPRMLYHARALADSLAEVDLVGYVEHELDGAVARHPRVRVHRLRPPPAIPPGARRRRVLAAGVVRILRQAGALLWTLLVRVPRPDVVLVQSPPAVPTLLVALAAARLRSARLIVDWHNLGYAMLALRLGRDAATVRLARGYEGALGRRADAHLCVSRALGAALAERWRIRDAVVLPDRPAARFGPTPLAARHELFARLAAELGAPGGDGAGRGATLLTRLEASGACRLREDRPALVVSPTSWTADEDFDLLLDALARCDAVLGAPGAPPSPGLLVVLTGDGPLRAHYEARIRTLALARIAVRTLWLAPEDYPRLLGAADLGLCLHRSASGVDLPMKVADFLGAGVPVCALDYGPCLAEQLRAGETGLLFASSDELAAQLVALLRGFPGDTPELDRLRRNVARSGGPRWEDAWAAVARPLFACRPR